MYIREEYLSQLNGYKDKNVIKIITGVRRSGKSSLLKMFMETLEGNVIYINMEFFENNKLCDPSIFNDYVLEQIVPGVSNYLIVDEVQLIKEFEKVINSFHAKNIVDIYITGSNTFMLSGDLATLLSGRYIEIKVFPFSYRELKHYKDITISNYLVNGGLPALFLVEKEQQIDYLDAIISSIITKDIMRYNKNIDERKLNNIIDFYIDNIGNIENSKKIADYIKSNSVIEMRVADIISISSSLKSAFLFYECKRYNISGKRVLAHSSKYYLTDMSFRKKIYHEIKDVGRVIENVVFMELRRKYKEIYIGKTKDFEIDFVVISSSLKYYIQVSSTVMDDNTLQREIRPLANIKDSTSKILITNDDIKLSLPNGIRHVLLEEFLLNIDLFIN